MADPEIIYEDHNFLAVNKPAGLVVHHAKLKTENRNIRGSEPTLVDWLLQHYPEVRTIGDDPEVRPGIVHRLDKETSGVMLVARTQKYFEYLKSLFERREIKKKYLAVVFGKLQPKRGIIDKPIGIKSGTLKRSVRSEKMQKEAITEYSVKKYFEAELASGKKEYFSLVEIEPKTGRTHQIRVHLASISHPIVGDRLYGHKKLPITLPTGDLPQGDNYQLPVTRLMLHALSLELPLEGGGRIKIEADPPPEFTSCCAQ